MEVPPCPECGATTAVALASALGVHRVLPRTSIIAFIAFIAFIAWSVATLIAIERLTITALTARLLTTREFMMIEGWSAPIGVILVNLRMLGLATCILFDRRGPAGRRAMLVLATVPVLVGSIAFAIARLLETWHAFGSGVKIPRELMETVYRFGNVVSTLRAFAIVLLVFGLVASRRVDPGRSGIPWMTIGSIILTLGTVVHAYDVGGGPHPRNAGNPDRIDGDASRRDSMGLGDVGPPANHRGSAPSAAGPVEAATLRA